MNTGLYKQISNGAANKIMEIRIMEIKINNVITILKVFQCKIYLEIHNINNNNKIMDNKMITNNGIDKINVNTKINFRARIAF